MPTDSIAPLLSPRPAHLPADAEAGALDLARELVQHRHLKRPASGHAAWALRLGAASVDHPETMRAVDVALCEVAIRATLEANEALVGRHLRAFRHHGQGQWSAAAFDLLDAPANAPARFQVRHLVIEEGRVSLPLDVLHYHAVHHLRLRLPSLLGTPLGQLGAWAGVAAALEPLRREHEERQRLWSNLDDVEADYPPCVKSWLASLSRGKHLPHVARFNLMAFLGRLGWDAPRIAALFRDGYDSGEMAFQANHVKGREGTQGYAPMGCSKLRSLGLCPDGSCPGVNPLSLYARRRDRGKTAPAEKVK